MVMELYSSDCIDVLIITDMCNSLATWQITTHTFMVAENLHAWFSVRVIGWFETKICDP